MKKQKSVVYSSSRRENAPEKTHAKTVCCMSGIIHLISNSQSPRRFLTFGKKQIKNESSVPAKTELPKPLSVHPKEDKTNAPHNPRVSSEIPRSPALPAEIRLSKLVKPHEIPRTPPALVARLMGLEEGPAVTVAEKRQLLLGALQKCDEDLQELKKIIEAVRSADQDQLRAPAPLITRSAGCWGDDKIRTVSEVTVAKFKGEKQLGPVNALDEFARSPVSPCYYSKRHPNANVRVQQQKQQLVKKKPGEEEMSNSYFYDRMKKEMVQLHGKPGKKDEDEHSVMWSSKAMIESVDEVCRDIAWGEERESGRIGLALQDHICRDLIEETIRELGCNYFYPLPLEACKRRLCF